jgi:hypothetical protein
MGGGVGPGSHLSWVDAATHERTENAALHSSPTLAITPPRYPTTHWQLTMMNGLDPPCPVSSLS